MRLAFIRCVCAKIPLFAITHNKTPLFFHICHTFPSFLPIVCTFPRRKWLYSLPALPSSRSDREGFPLPAARRPASFDDIEIFFVCYSATVLQFDFVVRMTPKILLYLYI